MTGTRTTAATHGSRRRFLKTLPAVAAGAVTMPQLANAATSDDPLVDLYAEFVREVECARRWREIADQRRQTLPEWMRCSRGPWIEWKGRRLRVHDAIERLEDASRIERDMLHDKLEVRRRKKARALVDAGVVEAGESAEKAETRYRAIEERICQTPPTTIAGAAVLMRFIGRGPVDALEAGCRPSPGGRDNAIVNLFEALRSWA